MSQSCLHFYPRSDSPPSLRAVAETLSYLHPIQLRATRLSGPDSSWSDIRDGVLEGPAYEILRRIVTAEEAIAMFMPGKFLMLDVASPLEQRLILAVEQAIPEAIRANHWPHNLSVCLDPHDIYEDAENTAGHLFARPSFSINFWGYSIPYDIAEYRRRVLALPVVIEIWESLSSILGPLDCQVYALL